MKKIILISLLILAFAIQSWSQTTLTVYPDKDALIGYHAKPGSTSADNNYGTYPCLVSWEWTVSGYTHKDKSLIGIDVSQLPDNANIIEAKLYLYGTGDHTTNLTTGSSSYKSNASYLRRVTTSWSESTVTWNTAPTTTTTNQVIIPNSSTTDQDYVVDVTNLIKDIQSDPTGSDGLMLSLVTEERYTEMWFASSDHATSSMHPKLEITYTIDETGVDFPEIESFELVSNKWDDTDGDDIDWILRTGSTPSGGTGPSSANHGDYYAYVESSYPNYPSKTAYLLSPSYNLSGKDNATLSFDYHMYGTNMGQLELHVSANDGVSWSSSSIWSKSGNQGNSWNRAEVDLSSYLDETVLLRFKVTTGSSYRSDIALDHIILAANTEANPSGAENYIMTTTAKSNLGASGPIQQSVKYFDGLGRPLQEILVGNSPDGKDQVKPMEYDNQGRMFKDYLPFAAGDEENGTFRDYYTSGDDVLYMQKDFFQDHFNLGSADPYAFSKQIYEESPLNRLLAQGAPGSDWQPSGSDGLSGHTLRYDYSTNTSSSNDDIRLFTLSGTICTSSGYYDDEELYANVVYSEDFDATNNDDALIVEYKDKQGKVVLKEAFLATETNPLRTYYVYDDFGLLRYVLAPEFSETFISSSGTLAYAPTTTGIKDYCYYYSYDDRRRMVEKQLPGAEMVYLVYDHRDRLVGTQDGVLRNTYEYIMTKYDELNRPVITARVGFSSNVNRTSVQGYISTFYDNSSNEEFEEYSGSGIGYTDQSYPDLSSAYSSDILAVTFYDNYDFLSLSQFSGLGFDNTNNIDVYEDGDGTSNGYFDRVAGQVTGTSILILDGDDDTWIQSATYYDDKYRVIQTQNDLFPNGKSMVSNEYDFLGNVIQSLESQIVNSVTNKIKYLHTYDQGNRLIDTYVYYNSEDAMNLSQNRYNELGQLMNKNLHSENNTDFIETVDYGYNIRGWLTSINNPGNLGDDKFGMKLFYQSTIDSPGSEAKYNGNISGISWKQDGGSLVGYGFSYDELNRLKAGNYHTSSGSSWISSNNFTTSYSYELNGNINSLSRRNNLGTLIDDVIYTYNGNMLKEVVDNESSSLGIIDDDVSGQDYYYDDNGNMVKDLNKNLEVDYNYLNLPEKVYEVGGIDDEISYIYDAAGVKWLKKIDNGSLKDIAYCGSFVYEDAGATGTFTLDYILTPEGKVDNLGTSVEYHYNLKDHLGNTRVEFDENGINQQVDYYPFGMTFSNSLGSENKYLYNGKELQDEQLGGVNLDWYDYGARFYDPQLGRWHVVDPLADKYNEWSPYNYVGNNPIKRIDPDGMDWDVVINHDQQSVTINADFNTFSGNKKTVQASTNAWTAQSGKFSYVIGKGDEAVSYAVNFNVTTNTNDGTADNMISVAPDNAKMFQTREIKDDNGEIVMTESPQGGSDGTNIAIKDSQKGDINVTSHEMGHNLGMGHSSGLMKSTIGGKNLSKNSVKETLGHSGVGKGVKGATTNATMQSKTETGTAPANFQDGKLKRNHDWQKTKFE